MNEENNPHSEKESKKALRWIKLFLGFNLLAFLGLMVWQMDGRPELSDEQKRIIEEREKKDIEEAVIKNRPPEDISGKVAGPFKYALDANSLTEWVHFRFATGDLFTAKDIDYDSLDWDIAFRRAKIVTNSGRASKGKTGVMAVDAVKFDSLLQVPDGGELKEDLHDRSKAEPYSPILDKWYRYDFWTHRLTPLDRIYIIRTTKGAYVKFQILDFYCGAATACYTFRYAYQGDGGKEF